MKGALYCVPTWCLYSRRPYGNYSRWHNTGYTEVQTG
jgi:hypothetical protein